MNVTRLRVVDTKCRITAVPIRLICKIAIKSKNIVHESGRKFLDIFAAALIFQKLAPRSEQVIDGYDIMVDMTRPHSTLSLSLDNASILQRIKEGYLLWVNIVPHISKGARYTIGARIENKFLDLLELSYVAYFTEKEQKAEKIAECIFALDTLKFLVAVSWEGKLVTNKQCEEVARKLEESGRMFYGWKKGLENPEKKNRDR